MDAPVTEELLARYPFIAASRRFLAALKISLEELGEERYRRVVERALERVLLALRDGDRARIGMGDDLAVEIVSFPVALVLVAAAGDKWLARRWALAEALRCGRFLESEGPEAAASLLSSELGISVSPSTPRDAGAGLPPYRVSVPHYLALASRIDGPEWRLVNRVVRYGWVYVYPRELARLAVEAIQQRLVERVGEAEGLPVPDHLAALAARIRESLAERRRYMEAATRAVDGAWPPCMLRIRTDLLAGERVGHFANFALAAFMINAGYTVDQVVAMYSQRSDFKERIARYQVEHIAGQRGGGTKYTPPSCSTMRVHGLCVEEGRLCPGIKNPIQYYRGRAGGSQGAEKTFIPPAQ